MVNRLTPQVQSRIGEAIAAAEALVTTLAAERHPETR
jgi:hypothetical protein